MDNYIAELIDVLKTSEMDYKGEKSTISSGAYGSVVKVPFLEGRKNGNRLFIAGNGGSAAIAIHMTADFMKNGGVRAVSLYDDAVLTCLGNDYGYEHVFDKQLEMLAQKGDILIAISSSGRSQNIVNAINQAKNIGMTVITFTGFDIDNTVRGMGDINVYVPSHKFGIVESIHNLLLQEIVDEIYEGQKEKDF